MRVRFLSPLEEHGAVIAAIGARESAVVPHMLRLPASRSGHAAQTALETPLDGLQQNLSHTGEAARTVDELVSDPPGLPARPRRQAGAFPLAIGCRDRYWSLRAPSRARAAQAGLAAFPPEECADFSSRSVPLYTPRGASQAPPDTEGVFRQSISC